MSMKAKAMLETTNSMWLLIAATSPARKSWQRAAGVTVTLPKTHDLQSTLKMVSGET